MVPAKQVHCYLVELSTGKELCVWSHHHEVLPCGAVSFYNKVEFESQLPTMKFWKTIPNGKWDGFEEVDEAKSGVRVIGNPPPGVRRVK